MIKEIKYNRTINEIDKKLSEIVKYDDIDFGTEELKNYYHHNKEIFWTNIRIRAIYESNFNSFDNYFNGNDTMKVKERIKIYFKLNDYTWSK